MFDTAGNPTTFRNTSGQTFNNDNQRSADTLDGNGNPTTYGTTSVTYDAENRITAYGSTFTAGYDGDGLRAWSQSGSTKYYYLYDGTTPLIQLYSSGSIYATETNGDNGLLSRYYTGSPSDDTFWTFDPMGNTAQRLNTAQGILSTDLYDAWGNFSGSSLGVFGYGAQWGYYTAQQQA